MSQFLPLLIIIIYVWLFGSTLTLGFVPSSPVSLHPKGYQRIDKGFWELDWLKTPTYWQKNTSCMFVDLLSVFARHQIARQLNLNIFVVSNIPNRPFLLFWAQPLILKPCLLQFNACKCALRQKYLVCSSLLCKKIPCSVFNNSSPLSGNYMLALLSPRYCCSNSLVWG